MSRLSGCEKDVVDRGTAAMLSCVLERIMPVIHRAAGSRVTGVFVKPTQTATVSNNQETYSAMKMCNLETCFVIWFVRIFDDKNY